MRKRPWIVFTILLSVLLLAGCNLPRGQQAAPTPLPATKTPLSPSAAPATGTPVVPSPVPPTQVPPTQVPPTSEITPTTIALVVAPADVKTETLPAGEYQKSAPTGFRKLLVYPVGGIENMQVCENSPAAPAFQNAPSQVHALTHDPAENNFSTCGWKKNESVSITLTRPDGSQEKTSQTFDGSLALSYGLPMAYGMQLGDYSVTFAGPSGKVTHNFKVIEPAGAGMVQVEGKKYFVYGFQHGEHVYAMAYQKSSDALRLSTWREMTMGGLGNLLLDDQFNDDLLAVVGDTSGAVWSNWTLGALINKSLYYTQVAPCSGAPASRLQPFSFAYVTEGPANNVRSSPGKSAALVGTIKAGTVLVVQAKVPMCADGLLWWQIIPRDADGPSGWTAEGQGSTYWLAPLQ